MGTTKQTQQSSQFDPTAMATYKGLQGPLGAMTTGYMQDPFGNPFFRMQQLMGNRQAMNLGGTGTSNLLRNMTASGMFGGASSPAGLEMLQNQNRANTGLTSNLGFLAPVQNALGMQQWAGNVASNYRPLQTGQHQTESTSGLGTWLPQVAGMALGGLTGGLMGGGAGNFFGSANNFAQGPLTGGSINNPGMGAFGEGGAGVPWMGGMAGMGGGAPMVGGVGSMPSGMPGMGSQLPWAPAGPPSGPG